MILITLLLLFHTHIYMHLWRRYLHIFNFGISYILIVIREQISCFIFESKTWPWFLPGTFALSWQYSIITILKVVSHVAHYTPHIHTACIHKWLAQWDECLPFYWHSLTLIPAWISNCMTSKAWGEIINPFTNFNGATVEICEWISNFMPHFLIDVIICPWWPHQRETFSALLAICAGIHRWIPRRKASDAELWYFLWSAPE